MQRTEAPAQSAPPDPFLRAYGGNFESALRWSDLDRLWHLLKQRADLGWYVYAVGEAAPAVPVDAAQLELFLDEMAALLRRDHQEDYCAIVFADDFEQPNFVKIFDPNNLGVSCGSSPAPPLPGWIVSRLRPTDLPQALAPPQSRRRWWRRLFSGGSDKPSKA